MGQADAKKGQSGLQRDRTGGLYRSDNDQGRHAVGQYVAEDDARLRDAKALRRFDVLFATFDKRRRADRAGVVSPLGDYEREDDLVNAFSQGCDHHQRDE